MASYDYKSGKERIVDILSSDLEVKETDIPKDERFTFKNGYYGWVTAIFVDIRESSKIFSLENKQHTSKMIRSFTSEVIEILRDSDQLREIGIRGDCVYAIYNSPKKSDEYDLADRTFYINTFMIMLNRLLIKEGFNEVKVGIGISTAKELVVKAGRKDTGINNKVWIGDAVTKASNLSSLGSKDGKESIVMSKTTYDNFIDKFTENYGKKSKSWFRKYYHEDYGTYYNCNIIDIDYKNWIKDGMN